VAAPAAGNPVASRPSALPQRLYQGRWSQLRRA